MNTAMPTSKSRYVDLRFELLLHFSCSHLPKGQEAGKNWGKILLGRSVRMINKENGTFNLGRFVLTPGLELKKFLSSIKESDIISNSQNQNIDIYLKPLPVGKYFCILRLFSMKIRRNYIRSCWRAN